MEEVTNRGHAVFVKVASNKGAPGPDRQRVERVREHLSVVLENLAIALQNDAHRPGDIRRVWVPKTGGGERGLGIFPAWSIAWCKKPCGRLWNLGTSRRSRLEPGILPRKELPHGPSCGQAASGRRLRRGC